MFPEAESQTVVRGSTAKIDDESQEQEANNRDYLDTGKDEFCFTIDLNGEDIQADNHKDDYRDPSSNVDVSRTVPVLDDD
jgi:hypothetical protein